MNTTRNEASAKFAKTGARVAFTVAGAVAGSLAMEAEGAIHYSGQMDLLVSPDQFLPLDLDGVDGWDVGAQVFSGSYNWYQTFTFNNPVPGDGFLGNFWVDKLEAGAQIDSTGEFDAGVLTYGMYSHTPFANAVDAYIGFRFSSEGELLYGWMRVDVDTVNGTILIHDWAYEDTPGEGIEAGSTVPEPSSLALLTMGGAALATMRRRRRG